jgi:hypothetical protein
VLALQRIRARADHIDDLIADVTSPSVRSSVKAAIDLFKSGDPRAVRAFTFFVVNHRDEHVRRLSALVLGKLVDAKSSGRTPVARIAASRGAALDQTNKL